jgi:isopentenyl diphosphate isomerase/L-lactate dehydrogenase-like FMN-dependent dehydrogenase
LPETTLYCFAAVTFPYHRRQFLRFLAGSPFLARAFAQDSNSGLSPGPSAAKPAPPGDVLDVRELESLAHQALPPAHWGYLASGVDDDYTLQANIGAFKHIGLRPKRLSGVAKTDTSVELFGTRYASPLYLSAVGAQRMFHPDGELATARAAKAKHTAQMLSTMTSIPVEDVAGALGAAPWYQLYMPTEWQETASLVRRVEAAGCTVLMWTVDILAGRNTETATRLARTDTRNCPACHTNRKMPMVEGRTNPAGATWDYVGKLKKMTRMKVILKGLDTREDARLAVEHGADGIVVSNHGGRATETLRPTIECLPEVLDAVRGKIPVFVDGGFRRGADVYKALALGAKAVGIGRPYIYGLSAFGQAGVERVLEIMNGELALTMRQCGAASIAAIDRASVTLPATLA